jgi:hypothetical protein
MLFTNDKPTSRPVHPRTEDPLTPRSELKLWALYDHVFPDSDPGFVAFVTTPTDTRRIKSELDSQLSLHRTLRDGEETGGGTLHPPGVDSCDLGRHSGTAASCSNSIKKVSRQAGTGHPTTSCPRAQQFDRTDPTTGETERVALPCKTKGCPVCGPTLKRGYIAHYVEVLGGRRDRRHVVLTLDPKCGLSRREARKYLTRSWAKFVKRLKRRTGNSVQYVAFAERHGNGLPHLHAVLACDVTAEALREQWFEAGGGVAMDVQLIAPTERDLARTVGYVLKQAFGPDAEPGRIIASQGDGYHSAPAKAARASYAARRAGDRGPALVWERLGGVRRQKAADDGDPAPSARDEARFDALDLAARSRSYVQRSGDGRHGVRYELERDTGQLSITALRFEWDGQTNRTTVLATGMTEAEAWAAVEADGGGR